MSVLLRNPAIVPALFSRAVDADRPAAATSPGWHRVIRSMPLAATWAAVMMIDVVVMQVPLARAAADAIGRALPG